jgi:hypothetical protein
MDYVTNGNFSGSKEFGRDTRESTLYAQQGRVPRSIPLLAWAGWLTWHFRFPERFPAVPHICRSQPILRAGLPAAGAAQAEHRSENKAKAGNRGHGLQGIFGDQLPR